MRLAGLLALVVALGGCASVPFSTAMRLRNFDEAAFVQLQPEALRVKMRIPVGFALDPAATKLVAGVKTATGTVRQSLSLDVERRSREVISGGWFRKPVNVEVYWLALSDPSMASMSELQRTLQSERLEGYGFEASWRLSEVPELAESIQIWVDLKLFSADGYMRLIDGAKLPINWTES